MRFRSRIAKHVTPKVLFIPASLRRASSAPSCLLPQWFMTVQTQCTGSLEPPIAQTAMAISGTAASAVSSDPTFPGPTCRGALVGDMCKVFCDGGSQAIFVRPSDLDVRMQ